MPTGGGKSLCYQIPALIFEGLTVVVSPLISLMKDQVEQLGEMGLTAVFLNSSLPPAEYRRNVERIRRGTVKLLYLAPETLLKPNILAMLSAVSVDCLTIDEAHCISEWGHDFRPEYRQLVQVRGRFPKAVCVALTATATPRVREDIRTNLDVEGFCKLLIIYNLLIFLTACV
jgi:ATP-dependent DNA helicase RecQ